MYSFKNTKEYREKEKSFYIEPLLSSKGQLFNTDDMFKEVTTKKVYFKTYHTDNHFLLAVLMKKDHTKNKRSFYHCLICDSDIDKVKYPTFTAQQFEIDVECQNDDYKKRKFYDELKVKAELIHNHVVVEINGWLEHWNCKVTSNDSINGMFIIS